MSLTQTASAAATVSLLPVHACVCVGVCLCMKSVYRSIRPQMQTRCLTAVDLAERSALQIQFLVISSESHF